MRGRTWAMPHWFEATEAACFVAGVRPSYLFVADSDDPVVAIIMQEGKERRRLVEFVWTSESDPSETDHEWTTERISRMVELRNLLLGGVRSRYPEHFWSVDSDIFVHPQALASAIVLTSRYDVVGSKCYMSAGVRAPSYAMMPLTTLLRPDSNEVTTVDIVMAVKLMNPRAYAFDYSYHYHGEDVGISMTWKKAGLKVGWDGRVCSKHVMDQSDFLSIDERCGY